MSDAPQFLWGIGFAWNHPGEIAHRRLRSWVSTQEPDLFGPIWVWQEKQLVDSSSTLPVSSKRMSTVKKSFY